MKKILMSLVAVSCLVSFAAPAFAGDDGEKKEKPAKKEKKEKKEEKK